MTSLTSGNGAGNVELNEEMPKGWEAKRVADALGADRP